jgi:hypothetical protein
MSYHFGIIVGFMGNLKKLIDAEEKNDTTAEKII